MFRWRSLAFTGVSISEFGRSPDSGIEATKTRKHERNSRFPQASAAMSPQLVVLTHRVKDEQGSESRRDSGSSWFDFVSSWRFYLGIWE